MCARVFMFVRACVRRMVKIINTCIKINIAFIAPFQEKKNQTMLCKSVQRHKQRELAAYAMCVQY
jgi:hypothetical protein